MPTTTREQSLESSDTLTQPAQPMQPINAFTRPLPTSIIPIRRGDSTNLSDLMDTQPLDNREELSELSFDEQEQDEFLFHTSRSQAQRIPYTDRPNEFVNVSTDSLATENGTFRPPRTLPLPSVYSRNNRRLHGLHSLNNNILRNVNSDTSPSMRHSAFPLSLNRNIQSRTPNIENGNFFNDINRHSTESLLNEMSETVDMADVFFDLTHEKHKLLEHQQSYLSIDERLDQFLGKRQISGFEFDQHFKEKKSKNSKKRTHGEADGLMDDTFKEYRFNTIRPQHSSFLKPGITFTGKRKAYKMSLITVDYESGNLTGVLSFKNGKVKGRKLKSFLNPSNKKQYDGASIPLLGQVISFEREDMRFHSSLQDDFEHSLRATMSTFQRFKDFYSVYNNCLVRKQLSRWMTFKPFSNLTIGKLLQCITCEKCLERLQSKFILFRLYIDADSKIPDLLCCIDRSNGQLELVTSGSAKKQISENMFLEREISHYDKEECTVLKMCVENAYYSSPSVKLR